MLGNLFLKAHSFLRASVSENCWLLGTDNVREQQPSIFSRQMEAFVNIYLWLGRGYVSYGVTSTFPCSRIP